MGDTSVHKKHRGGCLCGRVQFIVHGELMGVVNCHCSKCRNMHGSYGAYTSVKLAGLEITDKTSLKWYKSTSDETANVRRGFCLECGSSLFWHPKDHLNISIAAGSLESPTNLRTIGHIWCSQEPDFYEIEGDLPQFDERWGT